jgi:membrane-bound serine protease (ClpP class)
LSRVVVFTITIMMALFFALIVGSAMRVRDQRPVTGAEALIGRTGVVRSRLDPTGMVYLNGELWEATTSYGPIDVGERVTVTAIDGLRLTVVPAASVPAASAAQPTGGGTSKPVAQIRPIERNLP